ncbi:L,D-transpeptidase family protein [Sphingomonas sp. SUN019]|uniref:L,D-transpeptidase family protein n=1 Tax=Sphingomonas sp. SUN019 TaxID=2937788 RepID=UPI0021642D37|nr:L,D-transpeptidase family protein [Sphingomonas sp. SUN019]UVO51419.1 L,D-transpeptidase family protein [Sphingomonas sp. SUN019]
MPARVRAAARHAGWLALPLALAAAATLPSVAAAQAVAVAPTESSAVAKSIRDQVGGKIKNFYRQRGYWPIWVTDTGVAPQAQNLVDIIETVDVDGLDPDRYNPDRLRRLIAESESGDPKALGYTEIALSAAFAELVRDMRNPRIDIRYLDTELEPQRDKPEEILRRAALAPSFGDYVARMGWMSPLYARLRTALAESRPAIEGPPVEIPPGPLLKPGATGDRVALLRQRLGLDDGNAFDDALAARVRRFQASHGLPADGIAGARTIAALNTNQADPAPDRRALLHLNLERARLLPGAWTRHIVVDAAGARLWYFGEGSEQGTMRVVVGTPETQTPMMAGMIRYATLNPYWNVPVDLVRKRIAPKVLAGKSLAALGYEAMSDWTADATVLPASSIDWRAVEAGTVEPRVRELPGRGNSMGSVKFMFPNDQGIYLHDTPQKALFAKADRHLSNGCVRLEDASRLGRWLFGQTLKPKSSAPEQHLPVPAAVPVYLLYFTASPAEERITYTPDTYGRDAEQIASR